MTLENGYKMQTTFWEDFSIADKFGEDAIVDTYKRAFIYKFDIKFITELAIVLNLKIWQYYQKNDSLAELYDKLWRNVDEYIIENFDDEDLRYYSRITD